MSAHRSILKIRAELDLLVVRGSLRLGFEFKRTAAPSVTLSRGIRAVALARLLDDLEPLR